MINTKRVHPIIYSLIVNKLATLDEIKHKYDVWDVIDLYEIALVQSYNQYSIIESSKK